MSAVVLTFGFYGALHGVSAKRIAWGKAIARFVIIGIAAALLVFLLFPKEIGPRLAFYTESLDPTAPATKWATAPGIIRSTILN